MGEMIDWNKYMQSSDGEKIQILKSLEKVTTQRGSSPKKRIEL